MVAAVPCTPWQAVVRSPLWYLRSAWPWRSLAYVISGAAVGLGCLGMVMGLAIGGAALTLLLVGLILLLTLGLSGLPVAALERRRLRLVTPEPVTSGHRTPTAPGPAAWLRLRLGEWATWRELTYTLLLAFVFGPLEFLVTLLLVGIGGALVIAAGASLTNHAEQVTLGVVTVSGPRAAVLSLLLAGLIALGGAYLVAILAAGHAAVARVLLGSREEQLGAQVTEVSRSRARLVDAFEAERRRIERDLHDGAQQRLVSLTMKLGLARMELDGTGGDTATLVADAHEDAKRTLSELRELVHGIHPQILTDRGLEPALTELAGRSTVPAVSDVRLADRLPPPVESAAYFMVSEALVNVAKHARAEHAHVRARLTDGALVVEVTDDGAGGADPEQGSGLQGLADRLAVVHGTLGVSSPPGGPTTVRMTIPATEA